MVAFVTSLIDDPVLHDRFLSKIGAKNEQIFVVDFFPDSGIDTIKTEVTNLIESS